MNVESPKFLAQAAHVGWGCALTLLLRRHVPTLDAVCLVAAFAFLKELVECTLGVWEERDTVKGSAVDFAFWVVGIVLGCL